MKVELLVLSLWGLVSVPVEGFLTSHCLPLSSVKILKGRNRPGSECNLCKHSQRDWRTEARSLLSTSSDSEFKTPSGSNDIFDALMNGDAQVVLEYIKKGGDCSLQDGNGDTPVMLAIENEMSSVVLKLIEDGGADVNYAKDINGETPLMLAAYYGYTSMVKTLVERCGANLDARNLKGDTALNLASFWGNVESVRYLLEAGADPNVVNTSGKRAGDHFDTVFVSGAGQEDYRGGEVDSEGEPLPSEVIVELLEEARAALITGR